MEEVDHVEEEAWISAMVAVLKAKEGKTPTLRWGTDFRQLNLATREIRVPLPTTNKNLEQLAGARMLSSLDYSNAYFSL